MIRNIFILFLMALGVLVTSASYILILKLMIDSDVSLSWCWYFWFFGGVAVYAIIYGLYILMRKFEKKRDEILNKKTNDIYQDLKDFFY